MIMTSQVKFVLHFGAASAFKVRVIVRVSVRVRVRVSVMVKLRVKVRFRVQKELGFDP